MTIKSEILSQCDTATSPMRNIFLLVPSMNQTGPIKGAVALANALATERQVTLVSLKEGPGVDSPVNPAVQMISLAKVKSWRHRLSAYKKMLADAGGRHSVASISMCLSADMVNFFCRPHAVTCASVRGNLVRNYRSDYGLPGAPIAMAHLSALRGFDHIVAMNSAMAKQMSFYARRPPSIIGNFVDESALEPYRYVATNEGPLRFVFVASLSPRKRPLLLIDMVDTLTRRGIELHLDIVGTGPLHATIEAEIARRGLADVITLHGQLACPYPIVAQADALILPSLSEGVPRAALEALHLGVPCVLRDVDGNTELIHSDGSGALFRNDAELADVALQVAQKAQQQSESRTSLLPDHYRQGAAAKQYLALVEQ